MKQFLTLVFLLGLSLAMGQRQQGQGRPQTINITGIVYDQDTGQPLEYATLVLQSVRRPDRITGGITDSTGKFTVEAAPGQYNVRVEYMGYKTYELPNQTFRSATDLGRINLGIDAEQLEAVEVIGTEQL